MPFCKLCGKNLDEGEKCTCKASGSEENFEISNSDVSALPEETKKSIPYIPDIFNLFRRTISKNTIKQVSLSAKENNILWTFVIVLETLINSLALTVVIHRGIYTVLKSFLKPYFGANMSYGDSAAMLKKMGLGFFSLFSRTFIIGIIVFFITVALIYVLLKICKKKCVLNNISNMISTAAIPLTFLSVVNLVLCFILPQAALLVYIVAVTSVLLLMYFGIQKLDKFTESPFWIYMAFIFVLLIACFLITKLLMPEIELNQIFSGIF